MPRTYTKVEAIMTCAGKIRDGVVPAYRPASTTVGAMCAYRLQDRECVIGALVSREDMPADFDGDVVDLARARPDLDLHGLIEGVPLAGLMAIQKAHDRRHPRNGIDIPFPQYFFGQLRVMDWFKDVPESVWEEALRVASEKPASEEVSK